MDYQRKVHCEALAGIEAVKYKKLNINWNAEPNAPNVKLIVEGFNIKLSFFLNHFLFENFKDGEQGVLTFTGVHKFSFNSTNDEGYFKGQYRYRQPDLPWGEFYELDSDWRNDFHENYLIVLPNTENSLLKHYIFFLRDNVFECVAEGWRFESGGFGD